VSVNLCSPPPFCSSLALRKTGLKEASAHLPAGKARAAMVPCLLPGRQTGPRAPL